MNWIYILLIVIVVLIILLSMSSREGYSENNSEFWRNRYYALPYSRSHNWSPGYYTGTGWSYQPRPGIGIKSIPRNRWARATNRNGNRYYYVTNRGDYRHDAANYVDTPLIFA